MMFYEDVGTSKAEFSKIAILICPSRNRGYIKTLVTQTGCSKIEKVPEYITDDVSACTKYMNLNRGYMRIP